MANVTMTSVEYLEFVDYARDLEQVEREMIDNVQIEPNLESNYKKYTLNITPTFTEKIRMAVVNKIAKVLITETEIMDSLYANNSHYVDIKNNMITWSCYEKPDKNLLDLCTYIPFKTAWDKAKCRAEEAKEKEE